jgi:predicted transcriptional regulator
MADDLDAALRAAVSSALSMSPMSTSEIARELDVTEPYVSNLRKGVKGLSVDQARRVLRVVGFDVDVRVSVRLKRLRRVGKNGG